jgi:hypothetical protein
MGRCAAFGRRSEAKRGEGEQTWWGEAPVRCQDIGNTNGQDMGYSDGRDMGYSGALLAGLGLLGSRVQTYA